jgi:hypothetical protein
MRHLFFGFEAATCFDVVGNKQALMASSNTGFNPF